MKNVSLQQLCIQILFKKIIKNSLLGKKLASPLKMSEKDRRANGKRGAGIWGVINLESL